MMGPNNRGHWLDQGGTALPQMWSTAKTQSVYTRISKTLSRLLRHHAALRDRRKAIPCDSGGWLRIRDILSIPREVWGTDMNMALLLTVVAENEKTGSKWRCSASLGAHCTNNAKLTSEAFGPRGIGPDAWA